MSVRRRAAQTTATGPDVQSRDDIDDEQAGPCRPPIMPRAPWVTSSASVSFTCASGMRHHAVPSPDRKDPFHTRSHG
jgi:hypothetical protein